MKKDHYFPVYGQTLTVTPFDKDLHFIIIRPAFFYTIIPGFAPQSDAGLSIISVLLTAGFSGGSELKEIYLDNSATTRVCPSAAKKALELMTDIYGNPSSLHSKGLEAQHETDHARRIIADSLGAKPGEIYFTSGGTEANNTAVFGAAHALRRRGNRIVTTAIEHSSVFEAMQQLEKEGFEVIFLRPYSSGCVRPEDIRAAINKDTILVSIMAVNNALGSIQPIQSVYRAIAASGSPALFHVDAVQAYMKMPLIPKKLGIDLLSVSGHKIHAPKGIGALYVRKGARILPLHFGGMQEQKLRPGTEAAPLICAMGEAVRCFDKNEGSTIRDLNLYFRQKLSEIDGIVFNSDEKCLPYIINFSLPGLRSETLLHFLAERNIFVSSGSACAKGHKSHVLEAMEYDSLRADSALRISFSDENSSEDADIIVNNLKIAVSTLARR